MKRLTLEEINAIAIEKNLSRDEHKKLLIENGIIIKKPQINDSLKGNPDCRLCRGAGEYSYGGSFGGGVTTKICSCVKFNRGEGKL